MLPRYTLTLYYYQHCCYLWNRSPSARRQYKVTFFFKQKYYPSQTHCDRVTFAKRFGLEKNTSLTITNNTLPTNYKGKWLQLVSGHGAYFRYFSLHTYAYINTHTHNNTSFYFSFNSLQKLYYSSCYTSSWSAAFCSLQFYWHNQIYWYIYGYNHYSNSQSQKYTITYNRQAITKHAFLRHYNATLLFKI